MIVLSGASTRQVRSVWSIQCRWTVVINVHKVADCLSVCLSVCLCMSVSVCQSVSVSPYMYQWICLLVGQSVCRSVCLSTFRSIYLSVCLSGLPICLSSCQAVCLFVWLSCSMSVVVYGDNVASRLTNCCVSASRLLCRMCIVNNSPIYAVVLLNHRFVHSDRPTWVPLKIINKNCNNPQNIENIILLL